MTDSHCWRWRCLKKFICIRFAIEPPIVQAVAVKQGWSSSRWWWRWWLTRRSRDWGGCVYISPRRSKSSLTSNLQSSLMLKQQCFAFHTWRMIEDLETFCNEWVRLSSTPTPVHREFNTLTINCQSCIFASLMFTPCAILVDWGDIIFADVLKLHPSQQTFCCCPSRAGQLTQLLDQG